MAQLSSFQNSLLDQIVGKIRRQKTGKIPGRFELASLQTAWGNIGFMASLAYLKKIASATVETDGPILECGSGLTTILMGLLTEKRGIQVYALEHHQGWHERVSGTLEKYGLDHVKVIHAPLNDFGDYQWYNFDKTILPAGIELVVCDGPPGNIKGSRYGLVPETDDYLASHCTILLDDANRKKEKDVMENWKRHHGFEYQMKGIFNKFAMVNRPQ